MLGAFASTSSTLNLLRSFITSTYTHLSATGNTTASHYKTFFAFVEGTEQLLNEFGGWCSSREERILLAQQGLGPQETVTLLSLERDLREHIASHFDVLESIITLLFPSSAKGVFDFPKLDPSWLSKTILDQLLLHSQSHLCMGDAFTVSTLNRMFVHAVAPLWGTIRHWMKVGVPVQDQESTAFRPIPDLLTDKEYFVEVVGGLSDTSDSWVVAAVLRTRPALNQSSMMKDEVLIPLFLEELGATLLSAGKAVGLLRALGVEDFFHPEDQKEWVEEWATCKSLFANKPREEVDLPQAVSTPVQELSLPTATRLELESIDKRLSEASKEALSFRAQEYLTPLCQAAQSRLNRLLGDDCRLWDRLECIQDVYLMGRGDIMSHFCNILFACVRISFARE